MCGQGSTGYSLSISLGYRVETGTVFPYVADFSFDDTQCTIRKVEPFIQH